MVNDISEREHQIERGGPWMDLGITGLGQQRQRAHAWDPALIDI